MNGEFVMGQSGQYTSPHLSHRGWRRNHRPGRRLVAPSRHGV